MSHDGQYLCTSTSHLHQILHPSFWQSMFGEPADVLIMVGGPARTELSLKNRERPNKSTLWLSVFLSKTAKFTSMTKRRSNTFMPNSIFCVTSLTCVAQKYQYYSLGFFRGKKTINIGGTLHQKWLFLCLWRRKRSVPTVCELCSRNFFGNGNSTLRAILLLTFSSMLFYARLLVFAASKRRTKHHWRGCGRSHWTGELV